MVGVTKCLQNIRLKASCRSESPFFPPSWEQAVAKPLLGVRPGAQCLEGEVGAKQYVQDPALAAGQSGWGVLWAHACLLLEANAAVINARGSVKVLWEQEGVGINVSCSTGLIFPYQETTALSF